MSKDHTLSLTGAHGLLHGLRTKSYGSLVTSPTPVRQKIIEHKVQSGDTLQGLSVKYGVSMEQIKRTNGLYTNDSIFLKKFLSIPVLTASLLFTTENEVFERETAQEKRNSHQQVSNDYQMDTKSQEQPSDLSPSDFLKRIDSMIDQSKKASVKACQLENKQLSSVELLFCTSKGLSASAQGQQAMLGAAPLAVTKCAKNPRDREDEIFQL